MDNDSNVLNNKSDADDERDSEEDISISDHVFEIPEYINMGQAQDYFIFEESPTKSF